MTISKPARHGSSRTCTRPARRRIGGQGLVEFSLVLPVFLFTLFSLMNMGFLLYSINAVDQSATVGSNSIAASGNASNSDILGVQRMSGAGLGTTALVQIVEIDVEELANDTVNGGFLKNPDGSPKIATGCAGVGGLEFASNSCVDRYTFSGSGSTPTVNVLDGTCAASVDVSRCPPWTPESRSVTNSAAGDSAQGVGCAYVALRVKYTYSFMGAPAGGITLSSLKTFRLEPQT
jgi:hypothetical protein